MDLTKREYFSIRALAVMLSKYEVDTDDYDFEDKDDGEPDVDKILAREAVKAADALIAELAKE